GLPARRKLDLEPQRGMEIVLALEVPLARVPAEDQALLVQQIVALAHLEPRLAGRRLLGQGGGAILPVAGIRTRREARRPPLPRLVAHPLEHRIRGRNLARVITGLG